jgi:hypothetical protein
LTSLNISNTALTSFTCNSQAGLATLTATNCTALTSLQCYNGSLTTLNVSGCTNLATLECGNNQLGALNITGDHGITTLSDSGNPSLTITGP